MNSSMMWMTLLLLHNVMVMTSAYSNYPSDISAEEEDNNSDVISYPLAISQLFGSHLAMSKRMSANQMSCRCCSNSFNSHCCLKCMHRLGKRTMDPFSSSSSTVLGLSTSSRDDENDDVKDFPRPSLPSSSRNNGDTNNNNNLAQSLTDDMCSTEDLTRLEDVCAICLFYLSANSRNALAQMTSSCCQKCKLIARYQ